MLIVDDLLATGGTAKASSELIDMLGSVVVEFCFIISLKDLKGKDKLKQIAPIYSVLEF